MTEGGQDSSVFVLLSANLNDFRRVPGLDVEDWSL